MNLNVYNYLNNKVALKYFWIISLYLFVLGLLIIIFNFKISIYKKFLSIRIDNKYLVYLTINEYKSIKDKPIYIGKNKINNYKYDLDNIYQTGYIILSIEDEGNDIEEVKIMIIKDYIYKVIINLMKGEYENT